MSQTLSGDHQNIPKDALLVSCQSFYCPIPGKPWNTISTGHWQQYHTLQCLQWRGQLNQCHWLNVTFWKKVDCSRNFNYPYWGAPQKWKNWLSEHIEPSPSECFLVHLCKVQFSHQLMMQQLLRWSELRELSLSKRVPKIIMLQLQWLWELTWLKLFIK